MGRRSPAVPWLLRLMALVALASGVLAALGTAAEAHGLTWTAVPITGQHGLPAQLTGVSCPSAQVCVAASTTTSTATVSGTASVVYISVDPAARPASWRPVTLPGGGGDLQAVACPTTTLCVTDDSEGDIWSTQDPTGTWTAWRRVSLGATSSGPVICTSATSCSIASDISDSQWRSTTPARGGWHLVNGNAPQTAPSAHVTGLPPGFGKVSAACASAGLCVAVGHRGRTATGPSSAGPWTLAAITTAPDITGLACPHGHCLAVDAVGDVIRLGSTGAASRHVTGVHGFASLACAGARFCLAGGSAGTLWTARLSAGGTRVGRWTAIRLPVHPHAAPNLLGGTGNAIASLACPSVRLCVAVDYAGQVLASHRPTRPGSWRRLTTLPQQDTRGGPGPEALTFVTCRTVRLCFAGDAGPEGVPDGVIPGVLMTSTAPGTARGWRHPNDGAVTRTVPFGTRLAFTGVACPAGWCLASASWPSGYGRQLAVSTHPSRGWRSWRRSWIGPGSAAHGFSAAAVACASVRLCVLAGFDAAGRGDVAVSRRPRAPGAWRIQTLSGDPLDQLSCDRARCFADSINGELFVASF